MPAHRFGPANLPTPEAEPGWGQFSPKYARLPSRIFYNGIHKFFIRHICIDFDDQIEVRFVSIINIIGFKSIA